jgi:hypothetical protein
MSVRRYGPGDYRDMPWKNGGGSTTELLLEPPGGSLAAGFLWRVSTASVAQSGPFSRFPGIDRTLLLLDGDGLELDHGPHGCALLPGPWEPARFSGDWTTRGRLLGGPCRDFNVMSARGRIRHAVAVLHPEAAPPVLPEAATVLVYCARGRGAVGGMALTTGHLLRFEGEDAGAVSLAEAVTLEAEAVLVVVALDPVPGG